MRTASRRLVRFLLFLLVASILIGFRGVAAQSGSNKIFLPLISGSQSQQAQKGIWISEEELAKLPTTGPAWEHLKEEADKIAATPDLSDRGERTNITILAKGLVYGRTGEQRYRDEVRSALQVITFGNSEENNNILPVGRNLVGYVVAADLIDFASFDPTLNAQFRTKLRELLTKNIHNDTLRGTHEDNPNNFGTYAGASRMAIAIYLGDKAELERAAQVFHGWLGNRDAYTGFKYDDDLSWQCDPMEPVGVNPLGCVKEGHDIGGALPEEMRRGGSFQWPPSDTHYPWTGLQGAVVQAEILHRAGYPAWQWEDQALLRAVQFLYDLGWGAEGDDEWQMWLINHAYGTNFPQTLPADPGKNMGWTDWTHAP